MFILLLEITLSELLSNYYKQRRGRKKMTIKKLIEVLEALREKHGDDINVSVSGEQWTDYGYINLDFDSYFEEVYYDGVDITIDLGKI